MHKVTKRVEGRHTHRAGVGRKGERHRSRSGSKLEASKGVRKPSVPMANAMTGGSAASDRNRDAVCSTVPSPPSVTQKSGISAPDLGLIGPNVSH